MRRLGEDFRVHCVLRPYRIRTLEPFLAREVDSAAAEKIERPAIDPPLDETTRDAMPL
jgi:hypothetical protein